MKLLAWTSLLILVACCYSPVLNVYGHPQLLECGGDIHSRLEPGGCGGPPTHPNPCKIMGRDVLFGDLKNSGVTITSMVGNYFNKTWDIEFTAAPGIEFVLEGLDGVLLSVTSNAGRPQRLFRKENCGLSKGGSQLYTNYTTSPTTEERYSIRVDKTPWDKGMIYLGWAKGGPPVTSTLFAYVGAENIPSPNNGVCYGDRCMGSNDSGCCQISNNTNCQNTKTPLSKKQSATCALTCCTLNEDPDKGREYWECPNGQDPLKCNPPLRSP